MARRLLWGPLALWVAAVASGQTARPPAKPSFQASGIQDNTAPSGYSTGASDAEAKKVSTLASELQANSLYQLLPAASTESCDREPALLRAAQAAPESFAANGRLGRFYLEHGSAAEAGRYLRLALQRRPEDRETLQYAALAELEAKNYAGASELVHRLLAASASDANAHKLLGALDAALGHASDALAEYSIASRIDPSAANLNAAALAELAFGSLTRAEASFAAATQAHPESAELWLGRGMAALLTGHKTDAGASFAKAAANTETRKLAYTLLAMEGAGNDAANARVIQQLKELTVAEPSDALFHYDYAVMLGKMNASNTALERTELQLALQAQPDFAAAHFALGVLAAQTGDPATAAAELTKATALDGEIPEWHYRLSQALRRLAQEPAASRELDRFDALKAARTASHAAEPPLEGIPAQIWIPMPATCAGAG
jgi:predicted Zn-dependent protease